MCSGRGSGGDGGYVPVGADAHGCAVLQQQERHVIVGVTAGVPVYGYPVGYPIYVDPSYYGELTNVDIPDHLTSESQEQPMKGKVNRHRTRALKKGGAGHKKP